MERLLYPTQPVRCTKTGPSSSGKSVLRTNLISNIINEHEKAYIYSPSLHQDSYKKIIECFTNYIPIQINPNILKEKDIDLVIEDIVNKKDSQKSDTEIEAFDNIENLKYPQEYEVGAVIIQDDLNEKDMNYPRVQAMFKRSRHNNLSIFINSQDYYEIPKRTIRANGNIYHIFESNNFKYVQTLYQDKTSMDMTLNEFKYLTSTCWIEKYQLLTFDMTEDRYQDRYRLGLESIFLSNSSPF